MVGLASSLLAAEHGPVSTRGPAVRHSAVLTVALMLGLLGGCYGRPDPGPQTTDPAPDAEPSPSPTMEPETEPDPEPTPSVCEPFEAPAGLGGPATAEVTLAAAEAELAFRSAREQERMVEALRPDVVQARYRLEQQAIDDGCVSFDQIVDVGRGLFMRAFTLEEGFGNDLAGKHPRAGDRERPNIRRFQRGSPESGGSLGGPDATRCLDCHWKGGRAGGGDRADNMVFLTDDDSALNAEVRNPPALWGAGWTQALAGEMTAQLHAQRDAALDAAATQGAPVTVALEAKGVAFGSLTALPSGDVDTNGVEGVDTDLAVKPFGWKGVFDSLRSFLLVSANGHLGLQAEELIAGVRSGRVTEVDLGLDDVDVAPTEADPDDDGVARELTEGQVTALAAYLATLDAPRVLVPEQPEFAARWEEGAQLFESIGCAGCHVPLMPLQRATFTTLPRLGGQPLEVDLAASAASPKPAADEDGVTWIPVFSDFKRHAMGRYLEGNVVEHGVATDAWLTRRLWGLYNTAPYLHDASAATLDEAIAKHTGEGSEARPMAEAYFSLTDDDQGSLKVFLLSLVRGPAVRVR